MRRQDKEITDRAEIESVIRRSTVCRLGLSDGDQPYVVPLCFGYRDGVLYFHGAAVGHKIDLLRRNPKVCVEFDVDVELVPRAEACQWSMSYRSVIACGRAALLHDVASKRDALDAIMGQYAEGPFAYSESALEQIAVIVVTVEHMTGKKSGYG